MATRIRLARRGRKRKPIYEIVVADKRSKRDGRFIEQLGLFNPNIQDECKQIQIYEDRALHWVMVGAQPSETTRKLLSRAGVMLRKHLQVGVNKGAITQETADERYAKWLEERKSALGGKLPFYSKSNPVEEEELEVEDTPEVAEVAAEETLEVEPTEASTPEMEAVKEEEIPGVDAPGVDTITVEEAPGVEAPSDEASEADTSAKEEGEDKDKPTNA